MKYCEYTRRQGKFEVKPVGYEPNLDEVLVQVRPTRDAELASALLEGEMLIHDGHDLFSTQRVEGDRVVVRSGPRGPHNHRTGGPAGQIWSGKTVGELREIAEQREELWAVSLGPVHKLRLQADQAWADQSLSCSEDGVPYANWSHKHPTVEASQPTWPAGHEGQSYDSLSAAVTSAASWVEVRGHRFFKENHGGLPCFTYVERVPPKPKK